MGDLGRVGGVYWVLGLLSLALKGLWLGNTWCPICSNNIYPNNTGHQVFKDS